MPVHERMLSPSVFLIIFYIFACFSPLGAQEKAEQFETHQDTGFYYTIKKGDTLWDLSPKFYNSPIL